MRGFAAGFFQEEESEGELNFCSFDTFWKMAVYLRGKFFSLRNFWTLRSLWPLSGHLTLALVSSKFPLSGNFSERFGSGLTGAPGERVTHKVRGFESLPLRHFVAPGDKRRMPKPLAPAPPP